MFDDDKYSILRELANLLKSSPKSQHISSLLKEVEESLVQILYDYCDQRDFTQIENILKAFEFRTFVDFDSIFRRLLERSEDVEFNLKLLKYVDEHIDLYDRESFYKSLLYRYVYFGQTKLVKEILSLRCIDDFEYTDICVDAFVQFFKNYEAKIEFREYLEEHDLKMFSVKNEMIEILLKNCGKFVLEDMKLLKNYFHKKVFNRISKLSCIINKLRDVFETNFNTSRLILSNNKLRDIFISLYDDNKLNILSSKQDVEDFVDLHFEAVNC